MRWNVQTEPPVVEGAEAQRLLFRRECNRLDSYGENDDDRESGEVLPAGVGLAELSAGVGVDEDAEERVLQLLKRKSYLLYRLQKVKCRQMRQNLARKQSVASFGSGKGGHARKQSVTSLSSPQQQQQQQGGLGRLTSAGAGASRPDLHKVSSAAQLAPPGFHRVVTEGGFFHAPTTPARGAHAAAIFAAGPLAQSQRARGAPLPPSQQTALVGYKPPQSIKDEDHDRYCHS